MREILKSHFCDFLRGLSCYKNFFLFRIFHFGLLKMESNVTNWFNENVSPQQVVYLKNRYQFLEPLGEGAFGEVCKYFDHENREMVAIKSLKDPHTCFKDEFSILVELRECDTERVNIITFKRLFSVQLKTYFVFECLEDDLSRFSWGKYFPLSQIRAVGVQLVTALQALQDRNIVHADIKPSNIGVVGFESVVRVKLIDFGCAFQTYGKHVRCDIGTHHYRSPEVVMGLPSDEGIDMWSLGCVLVELLISQPLYAGAATDEQLLNFFSESLGACAFPKCFRQGIRFKQLFEKCRSTKSYSVKETAQNGCHSALPDGLDDLLNWNLPELDDELDTEVETCDRLAFIGFLQHVLAMDPEERYDPSHALDSEFLTASHLRKFNQIKRTMESFYCLSALEWMH